MESLPTILPLADRSEIRGFIWCSAVFCVMVAIWTGLRIYARTVRKMPLVKEDVLYHLSVVSASLPPCRMMLSLSPLTNYPSQAAFYGYVVALYMATFLGGAGYHMNQLDKFHISRFTQSFLMVQTLYGLSMCTIKWSMLFMLKRIFAVRYFKVCACAHPHLLPKPLATAKADPQN